MPEVTRGQFAIAAVVVALLAWTVARTGAPRTTGGAAAAVAPSPPVVAAATAPAGEPGTGSDVVVRRAPRPPIVVHVAGAVRRPGVYRLKDGQRVADAVKRAGGPSRSADMDAINLATKARDGVQILVPRKGAGAAGAGGAAPAAGGAGAATAPAIVNLNTATAEQLETLDGVGPATAAKILQFRTEHGPFRSVDDLEQIPGIGPKKLAAMRPGATV